MRPRCTFPLFLLILPGFVAFGAAVTAQTPAHPAADLNRDADLQMVVMLSRHGVRSPLGMPDQYDRYSVAPWPKWDVPPGFQTAHGNELIKLFGQWDRSEFSTEGLLASAGCADAARVTIVADTDQRTRETGKALAEGMFPGCEVAVHSRPVGAIDPLFRSPGAAAGSRDPALAIAAIDGRIGGDPNNLTEAYRPQLAALDRVLAGCGKLPENPRRTSLFDIPSSLIPGLGNSLISARGPLVAGAGMAANLLLEYTQGMSDADVGWGCVDGATLRYLLQLDTASWEFAYRTPTLARTYASNLLDHIQKTLEQGASGKPVAGAVGTPGDKLVILVGHDSNIQAIAGALRLNWILDGLVDETPPGGALVFELWRSRADGKPFIRLKYTTQTLEQMRKAEPLTPANPPAVAPIFVPGCSRRDLSCTWEDFSAAMHQAIDPADVSPQP